MLILERKYLTKYCWFRLIKTVTGLSVVDTRRWCRIMKFKGLPNALTRGRQYETNNFETKSNYEIEVTKFADILCRYLEDNVRKKHAPRCSHVNTREDYGEELLERISYPNGLNTRPTTTKK